MGEVPADHDEVSTLNQALFATLDYNWASGWGLSAIAPVIRRDHEHIHNADGEAIPEKWDFTDLGDIRIAGRYQLPVGKADPARAQTLGLVLGLKLPTGKTDVTNAEGEPAERSLQPGTGTIDPLVGAYYQIQLPARGLSSSPRPPTPPPSTATTITGPATVPSTWARATRLTRVSLCCSSSMPLAWAGQRGSGRAGRQRGPVLLHQPGGERHGHPQCAVLRPGPTADLPIRERRATHRRLGGDRRVRGAVLIPAGSSSRAQTHFPACHVALIRPGTRRQFSLQR